MSSSNDIPPKSGGDAALDSLEQIKLNPHDWNARKTAASILYDFNKFKEAAELLWEAPSLPYKSQDIAFSVKVLSKNSPENAIRVVAEVVRRAGKNAEALLRLSKAFHHEGLPLLSSRMYGASLAVSNENFDIGFELESLWCDDHGELVKEWKKQGGHPQPSEAVPLKKFLGKAISFLEYTQRITEVATPELAGPVATPGAVASRGPGIGPVVPPRPVTSRGPGVGPVVPPRSVASRGPGSQSEPIPGQESNLESGEPTSPLAPRLPKLAVSVPGVTPTVPLLIPKAKSIDGK